MLLSLGIDPLEELMQWIHEQILQAGDDVWTWFAKFNGGLFPVGWSGAFDLHNQVSALMMATYVVIVVVGGLVVMTHESLQTRYSVKEIAPRLALGLGLAWASPMIIKGAWTLRKDIVDALLHYNKGDLKHWAFENAEPQDLLDVIYMIAFAEPLEYTLISVLTAVMLLVGVVVLAVTGIMRWLAWLGVVALAPLALACHGLPFTEGAARLWWRILAACIGSSIGQAGCIYLWRFTVWTPTGNLGNEFGGGADEVLPRHQYLSIISIVIAVWAMWKVHAIAFTWARGRPVRVPGARMVAGIVAWRTMDKIGLGRRRRGGHAATRKSVPQSLRTRQAATPAPESGPVPSGWNDGWDGGNQAGGLSPARGWRPRIDRDAAKRAGQRRGKPSKPRLHRNRPTLAVHKPAGDEKAAYARPPRLPSPSRRIPASKPTPTPDGRPGLPPRLRTTPSVATSTPSLPSRHDEATTKHPRHRIPARYPSRAHRDKGSR